GRVPASAQIETLTDPVADRVAGPRRGLQPAVRPEDRERCRGREELRVRGQDPRAAALPREEDLVAARIEDEGAALADPAEELAKPGGELAARDRSVRGRGAMRDRRAERLIGPARLRRRGRHNQ